MSPHAHARIKSIDTSKAAAAPGVLAVLTGADAVADRIGASLPHLMPEDSARPKGYRTLRPLLAADKVRCVGDRVAFVVAETPAQARDAAELVEVEYEPLPAVAERGGCGQAGRAGSLGRLPRQCRRSRLMFGNKEATDAAFAKAKHTVSLRLENNRLGANAIEPRAAIGDYNAADDDYTLYTTSQNPHGVRIGARRHIFQVPESQLRVISPDVGGGFGMKGGAFPDDALVLWASRRSGGRSNGSRRARRACSATPTAATRWCTASSRSTSTARSSGCASMRCMQVGRLFRRLDRGDRRFLDALAPGVYDIPALHAVGKGVFTNTVAGASLSRRRAAGGDLFDRAAARSRRARDRHRSGRDPAAQFHPAGADAAHRRRPTRPTTAANSRM